MSFLKSLFTAKEPEKRLDENETRLAEWLPVIRAAVPGSGSPLGPAVARAGELAVGSPFAFKRLDAYLKLQPGQDEEPLTLSLTHFESITLLESSLALARCARRGADSWDAFAAEVEQIRYRGGTRNGYASRLHYFSEWIADNAARGNVRDVSAELGGTEDTRPLRYMTTHRSNYPALASDAVFEQIRRLEERTDAMPRWLVPREKVPQAAERIEPGDLLGFTTLIRGLDVSHVGIAHRDQTGKLRVLQALLSANRVELSPEALPDYVVSRKAAGILVARPL